MNEHKQVEIIINEDYAFTVDEGLEDIIRNFFHWDIETSLSCIDNFGCTWIGFYGYHDFQLFIQRAFAYNNAVNGLGYERETLYTYLQENAKINISLDEEVIMDPNNENTAIGMGVLSINVNLRFPKEDLDTFRELFFEVFPPE